MSHFAKVEDGIVTAVIVAEQEHIDTLEGTWVQTSYNTLGGITTSLTSPALRKNFACIGMVYDSVRDAFYAAQPYDSWTLDEDTCYWEPPVAYPSDWNGMNYTWNEQTQSWDAVTP